MALPAAQFHPPGQGKQVAHVRSEEQDIVQNADQGEQAVGEEHDGETHIEYADADEDQIHQRDDPCFHGDHEKDQELAVGIHSGKGQDHAQVQVIGHVAVEHCKNIRRKNHAAQKNGPCGAGDQRKQIHQDHTAEIEQVEFKCADGMFHRTAQPIEEVEENHVEQGIAAQGLRQQPAEQPPDLSPENGGFVKTQQIVQKSTAVHHAGEGDDAAAKADVEHQITDAFVPVAEAEPLKTAADWIGHSTQLPRNGFLTF